MSVTKPSSHIGAWLLAFVAASLPPPILVGLASGNVGVAGVAGLYSGGYVLLFGMPMALLFRAFRLTGFFPACAGGFVSALIPLVIVMLLPADGDSHRYALAAASLGVGMYGAFSAGVFWGVLKATGTIDAYEREVRGSSTTSPS